MAFWVLWLMELNMGYKVVFFLSYPAVLHATGPLCELFIMDCRTFKMQIYGQTWRKCVFQALEPSARETGLRSWESVSAASFL